MIKQKPPKDKKCKNKECARLFSPARPLQSVCGPLCGLSVARAAREKKERAETAAKRKALRPRSEWMHLAQAAFNRFIRIRDADKPCVSCGRFHDGQWHAGHFLSTGARPELRFDESNVHRQCQPCNVHLHGNLVLYRAELIRRIGLEEVERLEGPQEPRKYTSQDLIEIRDTYVRKSRELEKEMESHACTP